jgi:hypothetical protein
VPLVACYDGGPVEFRTHRAGRGNLAVAGKQFWLGLARAGLTATFWADTDVIHQAGLDTR